MRPYYFLLLLVTIIECIEGSLTTNPIIIHSIDDGGPTFPRHLKEGEIGTNTAADDTEEEEERMPFLEELTSIAEKTRAARLIRSNAVGITETSKKVDEKKPGALKKFLGRLRAIDITGDKKGMVVAYSVLFIALAAILMIGYSIQKHNQETYVH